MSMLIFVKTPAQNGVPPGRRARNKEDKRRRIREAAAALFSEQGYAATTTRQVAARAGVAQGTLFLYAPTKEALLVEAFAERVEAVQRQRFGRLPEEAGLLEELLHVFDGFFRLYGREPELSRTFVRELLFLPPAPARAHAELTRAFVARLAERVEAARARGEVRADVDAGLAAFNAFSAYLTVLLAWLAGAEGSPQHVLRAALALQLAGLAANAHPRRRS